VTASGIEAAKAVLNCRTRDLLKESGDGLRLVSAEDVERLRGWAEGEKDELMDGEI
jgi:hypothetical protein